MKEFKTLVGESIGEASVCWSELPKGVFNSTRAKEIADEIISEYEKIVLERDFVMQYLNPEDTSFRQMADTFLELSKEQQEKLINLCASLKELGDAK